MVYSSVYRRSYREPSWDDYSKKEFFSKLQYRSDRRSVEHRHQPWKWNGETESDDENVEEIPADDGSYEGGRRWRKRVDRMGRSIPKQAWEEEKKDIKQPVHGKSLPPPEKLTYGEEDENKQKQSHEAKRMNHYNQKDEDDPKYSATDKAIVLPKEQECEEKKASNHKQSHHARPDNRNHRPSKKNYRSRSTSPGKKRLAKNERNKVPFLPYGMANEGPVDMWKTHNVLASKAEVYPAALRAQKRRQEEIKMKAEIREEAARKKELPGHFDADIAFPKSWWLTEYQRNYCREEDVKRHFLR
ncbi:centriole, cilia and spindle-associated protein-like [Acropora muricata]|uniref:centriole, cilia and spindle-associated protein-like n=1 Tax=Acropora muricata TaxID=159855 RepID=UPI0034E56AB3